MYHKIILFHALLAFIINILSGAISLTVRTEKDRDKVYFVNGVSILLFISDLIIYAFWGLFL